MNTTHATDAAALSGSVTHYMGRYRREDAQIRVELALQMIAAISRFTGWMRRIPALFSARPLANSTAP